MIFLNKIMIFFKKIIFIITKKKEDVIYFISVNKIIPNFIYYTENPLDYTCNSINNMFLHKKDPQKYPI